MRDIYKTAQEQKINSRYDLETTQLIELASKIPGIQNISGAADAAYDAIITAFKYGYAMGSRSEQNKKK